VNLCDSEEVLRRATVVVHIEEDRLGPVRSLELLRVYGYFLAELQFDVLGGWVLLTLLTTRSFKLKANGDSVVAVRVVLEGAA
jgi:hypothetical protein